MPSGAQLALTVLAAVAALVGAGALLALRARRDPAVRVLVGDVRHLRPREQWRLARALMRDRRVPLAARLLPAALVLYLLMPFDLIPDFVPVLGQLDDLLILVLTAWLIARLVPPEVIAEHRRAIVGSRSGGEGSGAP
jgi:uncharacterized membrane protein YkvA (DUF1232 family)